MQILGKEYKTNCCVEALVTCKLYIVNGLNANMLVRNNILVPKKIDLLISYKML